MLYIFSDLLLILYFLCIKKTGKKEHFGDIIRYLQVLELRKI